MSFKKCSIVMLSTNKKSKLILSFKEKSFNQLIDPKLILIEASNYQLSNIQSQHLYITFDEKIKEGDWVYQTVTKSIIKAPFSCINDERFKKIIATTDNFLICEQDRFLKGYESELPQPSQSFIKKYVEEYNKANIITDVMVEYIVMNEGYNKPNDHPYEECEILKINPKDNTITIRKVKDNWNKEEVEKLCNLAYDAGIERTLKQKAKLEYLSFEQWIEQNL